MCGLIGIIGPKPKKEIEETILNSLAVLGHRGPDEWGIYLSSGIGLGHNRLSIIDLANGHQPMVTENSALVFNGEIYNFIELKKELEALGRLFKTKSDTEVLLQSLEEWGPGALEKLNGQFSFLFWDKRNRTLLAGRDRFGIRPLYLIRHQGSVYFSSEMKGFDGISGFRREWSSENLYTHGLCWNTWGGDTVYANVETVPSASYMVFDENGCVMNRNTYYHLGNNSVNIPDNYEEGKIVLGEMLKKSVDLRLRSDVPVGVYLSGGIDSSVTSYLAKKIKNKQFKSFSVTFENDDYDESNYQQEMVDWIKSEHYSTRISSDDINEHFLDVVYHTERPVFRTAPLPLYLLSRLVREQDIKVVLTGEAADEIFCGYDIFKEVKLINAWEDGMSSTDVEDVLSQLYPHLKHYNKDQAGFLKLYYEGFLGKLSGPLAGLPIRMHNNRILGQYLNKHRQEQFSEENVIEKIKSSIPEYVKEWPLLRRNQYVEMKSLLSGYLLSSQGDRMAMANSVEGRFPFLDHNLVDWAFQIPEEWKLKDYEQKFILRDTYSPVLPYSIINRPKMPYQAPDLVSFFRNNELTEMAFGFLNTHAIKNYGLFDDKMMNRFLIKIKRRGTGNIGYRDNMLISYILSAQMAEYWIRNPKKKKLDTSKNRVYITE